jgi:hypothetical protein
MVASGSRLTRLLTFDNDLRYRVLWNALSAHLAAMQVGKKVYNTSRYTQPNIVVL